MAVASFLAGLIPLSISLSKSQLRFVSNIGVGVLVGTSMIVIIPEGLGALVPSGPGGGHAHSHFRARGLESASALATRTPLGRGVGGGIATVNADIQPRGVQPRRDDIVDIKDESTAPPVAVGDDTLPGHEPLPEHKHTHGGHESTGADAPSEPEPEVGAELPTFWIGFSMITGFILMFLIDRLPKHATNSQGVAEEREVRLDSLGVSPSPQGGDEESERFLGSRSEGPKQSRGSATTTGLVIHAAADGIAMGASSSTSNSRLGFIVFLAIMIHKAPAAFGLTSVLLRQGLSKRAARGHLLIFSLAAPAGAVATWFLITLLGGSKMDGDNGQWWTGNLLLFSAGTFLYVAVHAMQDDGHTHDSGDMNGFVDPSQRKRNAPQMRDTLATVGGMLLPLLTQIGHGH
ncbi:related to ATX2 - Putative Golgi transporter involved in homeostasis of manganese ions [Cephalotrichum gorgonifer]|uniref:Related to ATX2 - Putative Golgi transporter involved in homeostasis of manganese ions n=1 Tax=Cephalotrichum gorgonifer TaxID=2041049 RepID=A0AAE8SUB8_9PEZI|nr:related to ATX2 - Putative Golgi transporter involved in homeostasis of manganese ions [Cephalotrichum gorgonifer]